MQLDSRPAVVDCALYVGGVRQTDDLPLGELYERARGQADAFVWIGLHEPDPEQFTDVEKVFGLHPLAVEDALNPAPQRPKVERYTLIGSRAARIFEVVRRAADEAAEVADVWETLLRNRRAGARMVVERVRSFGPLRQGSDVERAIDVLWIFNDPAHYDALVLRCGWTPDAFCAWLSERMRDALLPD